MLKQIEMPIVCKFCKRKFILINTYSNTNIYICVKCSFEKENKELKN